VNNSGLPQLCISDPTDGQRASSAVGVEVKYFVHLPDSNPSIVVSSAVVCSNGLSPPFAPDENVNLFGHYFGVKFQHDGHTYICGISSFEFASCHRLYDDLTYKLAHPSNTFCLDAAVPCRTSAWVFEQIVKCCHRIRNANCELFKPSQYAVPTVCAQVFLNGAIGIRLPDAAQWVDAYRDNPEMSSIIGFVSNPGTITNEGLADANLNANY
jgi:hypothetical protein